MNGALRTTLLSHRAPLIKKSDRLRVTSIDARDLAKCFAVIKRRTRWQIQLFVAALREEARAEARCIKRCPNAPHYDEEDLVGLAHGCSQGRGI